MLNYTSFCNTDILHLFYFQYSNIIIELCTSFAALYFGQKPLDRQAFDQLKVSPTQKWPCHFGQQVSFSNYESTKCLSDKWFLSKRRGTLHLDVDENKDRARFSKNRKRSFWCFKTFSNSMQIKVEQLPSQIKQCSEFLQNRKWIRLQHFFTKKNERKCAVKLLLKGHLHSRFCTAFSHTNPQYSPKLETMVR